MDRIIYLFGALLMSAGIVVLLGITPEIITQDIMSLMSRQRSLKYCVAKAQGKVKQSRPKNWKEGNDNHPGQFGTRIHGTIEQVKEGKDTQ